MNQVKSALQFWQAKGVILQTNTLTEAPDQEEPVWILLETVPDEVVDGLSAAPNGIAEDRTDTPTAYSSGHIMKAAVDPQAAFEAIQPFWGFVQNALANLHSLPSSRLQSMMTSLAPGYSGRTLEELEAFLEVARSEGLLVKSKDGFWRLAAL
jgi:hypothetical protein